MDHYIPLNLCWWFGLYTLFFLVSSISNYRTTLNLFYSPYRASTYLLHTCSKRMFSTSGTGNYPLNLSGIFLSHETWNILPFHPPRIIWKTSLFIFVSLCMLDLGYFKSETSDVVCSLISSIHYNLFFSC